jgi:hypothetical protein
VTTYLDAAGAVREWINDVTGLAGSNLPLGIGAVLKQREGAASVPYVFLVELGASVWAGAEHSSMRARLSHQVYGPTRESAADGAVALAEAVEILARGTRVALPSAGVTLVGADTVDGPQWFPDGEEPRYVLDCDYLFL